MPNFRTKVAKATYDFSVDGGAEGAIIPAINAVIPKGAIVLRGYTDVRTAMTSGGAATVAVAAGGVAIKAATAYNDAAYSGVDAHTVTAAKVGSTGTITVTVATAALTAGIVDIYVEYVF